MAYNNNIKFSVIIPVYNEGENVTILHKELTLALINFEYELIYINDGSIDNTYIKIKKAIKDSQFRNVKLINLSKNTGQSNAIKIGLDNASFPIIVFIDGDLQNDPKDIPRLIEKIAEGYDLVQGIRINRNDSLPKKILPSKAANFILARCCGIGFKDIGCSLKAFKKELISDILFQQGIHRVLPAYFHLKRTNIIEVAVHHRKRIHGKSNYGLSRIFDLILEVIKIKYFDKNHKTLIFISRLLCLTAIVYSAIKFLIMFEINFNKSIFFLSIFLLNIFYLIIINLLYSIYIFYKNNLSLNNINIENYNYNNQIINEKS